MPYLHFKLYLREIYSKQSQRYAHDVQSTHIWFRGLMKTSEPFKLTSVFDKWAPLVFFFFERKKLNISKECQKPETCYIQEKPKIVDIILKESV